MNINFSEALNRMTALLIDRLAGDGRQVALYVVDAIVDDTGPLGLRLDAVNVDGHIGDGVADGFAPNGNHAALDDGEGVNERLTDFQRK